MPQPITDILVREAGRIGTDIYNRNFATSPWIHLTPRGVFPAAMGESIGVLTYERNAPTSVHQWMDVTIADGQAGGTCIPAAQQVDMGSTLRNYNLKRLALKGPRFCAEEQRPVFALRDQLDSIVGVLAEYSRIEWETRDRHEYMRLCKRKVIINDTGVFEDNTGKPGFDTFTWGTPGVLTQGVLDKFSLKLQRDGAGQSAMGKLDGRPVFTVILGAEASENIIKGDDDNRNDLRWGKPDELLRQIGVERTYRGIFHVVDPYPIRYKVVGAAPGVLTEVSPFIASAATKGTKVDINPEWEDPTIAIWEVGYFYDRTVFNQLIPEPIVAPHPKFKFDPVTYTGDWAILNILDEVENPRGQIIFHHGILAAGSKPIHPERGIAFMYKRCDANLALTGNCP